MGTAPEGAAVYLTPEGISNGVAVLGRARVLVFVEALCWGLSPSELLDASLDTLPRLAW
jgi:hypothetical protein